MLNQLARIVRDQSDNRGNAVGSPVRRADALHPARQPRVDAPPVSAFVPLPPWCIPPHEFRAAVEGTAQPV